MSSGSATPQVNPVAVTGSSRYVARPLVGALRNTYVNLHTDDGRPIPWQPREVPEGVMPDSVYFGRVLLEMDRSLDAAGLTVYVTGSILRRQREPLWPWGDQRPDPPEDPVPRGHADERRARLASRHPEVSIELLATEGFLASIAADSAACSSALMDSRIALVPRGATTDTCRFWQALRRTSGSEDSVGAYMADRLNSLPRELG